VLFENRMAAPVHDPESGVERAVIDDAAAEVRELTAREALVPEPAPAKKRGRPRKATA